MRGRPRTPTSIKAVRGTLRRDRTNAREPRPPVGAPRPPFALPRHARGVYKRLAAICGAGGMRVATVADGDVLSLTAVALAEYFRLARYLEKQSGTYETKTAAGSVMYRRRPEVDMAADAWRRALNGLAQLGLTPATRSKVEAVDLPLLDHLEAFRARKRASAGAPTGPERFFNDDPHDELMRRRLERQTGRQDHGDDA